MIAALLVLRVFAQRQSAPPTDEDRLLSVMKGISSITILDYVKEMSSEKYEGRLTGTASYDASAAWAEGLLKGWKYKPAPGLQNFLQTFPNPYTLVLPGAELTLHVPVAADLVGV